MSTSIRSGGLLVLDPSDQRVITVDWDTEALPATVTIDSSTFTVTALRQAAGSSLLALDNASILAGNRKTRARLNATVTAAGNRYLVSNTIVTAESPTQTIERQFTVLIQNQ